MAVNSEPSSHGPRKSPSRRKSKPKFEVPPEVVAAPTAAWVYRAEAVRPAPAPEPEPAPTSARTYAPPPRPAAAPEPASRGAVESLLDPTSLMLAAIETMAHTVAASTRIMLAAASLMGAPIEVTRKILGIGSRNSQ